MEALTNLTFDQIVALCAAAGMFCVHLYLLHKPGYSARVDRFLETMVSKKIFAWWWATGFLWFGKLDATSWVLLTAAIFGLDVWQKKIGLDKTTGEE